MPTHIKLPDGTTIRSLTPEEYEAETGRGLFAQAIPNKTPSSAKRPPVSDLDDGKDWPPTPPSARAAQRAHARLVAYAVTHTCEPSDPPPPPAPDAERVKIPKPWWQMWLWAKGNGCGNLMRPHEGDDDA